VPLAGGTSLHLHDMRVYEKFILSLSR